jgi:hypothetical protein
MIEDELLMAFADGELDELSRARVERALAEDAELRARLAQQQRLRATLAAHYGPTAEEKVPAHLRAMLESDVVRFVPKPRPLWQGWTALAASLLLGLALGRTLLAPAGGPVGIENGTMVARGPLAAALDMQLASAQPAGAPARIGISFAAADGRLCRTFDSAAMSGLACHGDRGWQLILTATGTPPPRGGYRQAGSGNPQVLATAQEMMAGAPFDAAAERRARDSRWRRRGGSR